MNRKSHDALEVGAVPLILNVSAVALTCGLCVFVNLDGCEVRRCDPCALVRLRVPCVSCVPALTRHCPGSPRCLFTRPRFRPSRGRAGVCRWVWMVVRFVCVIRVPVCARVSCVPRVCPGSPRCLFTGTVCVPAPPVSFCRGNGTCTVHARRKKCRKAAVAAVPKRSQLFPTRMLPGAHRTSTHL